MRGEKRVMIIAATDGRIVGQTQWICIRSYRSSLVALYDKVTRGGRTATPLAG